MGSMAELTAFGDSAGPSFIDIHDEQTNTWATINKTFLVMRIYCPRAWSASGDAHASCGVPNATGVLQGKKNN